VTATTTSDIREISADEVLAELRDTWGYTGFRALQLETVEAVLNQRDSLTLLPTGGGKSLCYQLPITFFQGKTALIISPLIALMEDQVKQARDRGYTAAALNSGQPIEDRQATFAAYKEGNLQLLYVSPERLSSEVFLDALQANGELAYIAVDEAHCISQWGHQFRPEYQQLGRLRSYFPNVALHGFTATATPPVAKDIAESLRLEDPLTFSASMFRANLEYNVLERESRNAPFMEEQLLPLILQQKGQAGIVYCKSRKQVEEIAMLLQINGIKAKGYHAGMGHAVRRASQDGFMRGDTEVMAATVAFGMGIDRGDIRFVIHTNAPQSMEHYVQEAGRAGRDGHPAKCTLFFNNRDFTTWETRLKDDLSGDAYQHALQRVWEVQRYADSSECRHKQLLGYFKQELASHHCTGCDVCNRRPSVYADAFAFTQRCLSTIWRLKEAATIDSLAGVLIGEASLLNGDLREVASAWPSYAQYKDLGRTTILLLIQQLERLDMLRVDASVTGVSPSVSVSFQGVNWLKESLNTEAPPYTPSLVVGTTPPPRLLGGVAAGRPRVTLPNAMHKPKKKAKRGAWSRKQSFD
jgi:ATP-dependent DNA helicase RecQ